MLVYDGTEGGEWAIGWVEDWCRKSLLKLASSDFKGLIAAVTVASMSFHGSGAANGALGTAAW